MKPTHIKTFALFMGSHGIIAQVVLMREFFLMFDGNELSMGIFLTFWLLLSALGAFWGGNTLVFSSGKSPFLLLLTTITPLLSFILLGLIMRYGTHHAPIEKILLSFLAITPCALLGGVLFTWLTGYLSIQGHSKPIGIIYFYEQAGSAIAGAAVYAICFIWLNTLQMLSLFTAIGLVFTTHVLSNNISLRIYASSTVFILLYLSLTGSYYISWRKFNFPHIPITNVIDTPYGQLWRVNNPTNNWYANGQPIRADEFNLQKLSPTGIDTSAIHFTTLYITDGLTNKKHNTSNTTLSSANLMLAYINNETDAYIEVFNTTNKYNYIALNISAPFTLLHNRYYTVEFYKQLAKLLNTNGQILLNAPKNAYQQYVLKKTLSTVFQEVAFLDELQLYKCSHPRSNTKYSAHVNTAHKPLMLKLQMGQFKSGATIWISIFLLIVIATLMFAIKPGATRIIFASGFAASSLHVNFWVIMQLLSAQMYRYAGTTIITFMLFLGLGALISKKWQNNSQAIKLTVSIAIIQITTLLTYLFTLTYTHWWTHTSGLWVLIPIASAALAFGAIFETITSSNKPNKRKIAGHNYSSDLLGGAFGALITTTWLIPAWGVGNSTLFVFVLMMIPLYGAFKINHQ